MVVFLDILWYFALGWTVLGICWFAFILHKDIYTEMVNDYKKLLFLFLSGPLIWACCVVISIGSFTLEVVSKIHYLNKFLKWLQKP